MTAVFDQSRLDSTFAALANTTRRALLAQLIDGAATVTELAKPFNLSLPAISKHLKVLEKAGLITQEKEAQYRPCSLDPRPLQEVASWAEQYQPIWENRFAQMDDYLQQIQTTEKDK